MHFETALAEILHLPNATGLLASVRTMVFTDGVVCGSSMGEDVWLGVIVWLRGIKSIQAR